MITLVLPPLTQLNTPYPSAAYLTRWLTAQGVPCAQRDLGLELVLKLFSREGLGRVFDHLEALEEMPEPAWRALALRRQHLAAVGPAIRFLQGRDRTLAARILGGGLLPGGPRLEAADLEGFGPLSSDDAARRLATLYLEDLADLVTSCVDPGFSLIRYHHHLAAGHRSFDPLAARLAQTTLVDALLDELSDTLTGQVIGLSVPFPGNLYAALRIGRRLKARGAYVVMGGGYVNTELREVEEPRLWQYVDALTYDDGEGPLLALLTHLEGGEDRRHRTRTAAGLHDASAPRPAFVPAADYRGLPLDRYLQLVDSLNPAHRLWSDGRWNKITLAHGCYWKRCAFCDVSLDYIGRYEPARVSALVDRIAELAEETGQSGFHFVDEAAPPKLLRELALALLERGLAVSWWGNIRFEAAFTPDLCRLLAAAGLVAVTGGLEVASDRLLKLMDKGITVAQAARAAAAFQGAGVMVHAYLMYGFPTQTAQETIDAAEVVRQLFEEGLLDSGFWHRFVLTRHSPVAKDPRRFKVQIAPEGPRFAANDLAHADPAGADHDRFDEGLTRSLGAWMRGLELERPAHTWFPGAPRTRVKRGAIQQALGEAQARGEEGKRLVWLGGEVLDAGEALILHHAGGEEAAAGERAGLEWLGELLDAARPGGQALTFGEVRAGFPGDWRGFRGAWRAARRAGLVLV
jgi:hypothetical protein